MWKWHQHKWEFVRTHQWKDATTSIPHTTIYFQCSECRKPKTYDAEGYWTDEDFKTAEA